MFDSLFKKLEELKEVLSKGDDALDAKIKAKMKAEMDKRKFGEADAIRHVIDRDRGEIPKPPKEKPLLQSEDCGMEKASWIEAGAGKPSMKQPKTELFHIHENGKQITDKPMDLKTLQTKHGSIKDIERSGSMKVIPLSKDDGEMAEEQVVKIDSNGQWSL